MQGQTSTLDSLRSKHEELVLRAEVQELERLVKGEELASRLVESQWGDVIDRREYLFDTPGWGRDGYDYRIATTGDRARGKSYPVFESEQDLQNIVGIGRYLADSTAIGIAAMEALLSFTLGTGFQYEAEPREEQAEANAKNPLVAEVNRAIEEILDGNQWTGDKEDECFRRAHRDGECLRWAKDEGGFPLIEIPEPSYLTEPAQVRDLEDYLGSGGYDWSFGVATQPGRHDRPFGYFLKWEGRDWDVAPAAEVSHVKLNVDRQVKRGVSDFYPTREVIEQTHKLFRNVMQGSAVQAAIAYIREHAPGTTGDQIRSFGSSKATHTAQQSLQKGGVQTLQGEKIAPGTIKDVVGMKYHAGPLGQPSHPLYISVVQAGFRMAGIRWGFPEFMLSADASNNNYASILVAGSPFIRASERRQAIHKRANEDLLWKALAVFVRRGRFQQHGIGTLTELKREVQLKVDAPNAAIANRLEEEGIRDKQQAAGILSKKTRSAQSNLDYDVEQANIREEPRPAPEPPLGPPSPIAAALESVRTIEEARAILNENFLECGGKGGKPGPCPTGRKPRARKPRVARSAAISRPKEKPLSARAARAKASYNPSTKSKQDASEALEHDVTQALGATKSGDNLPMDVTAKNGLIGLEVKMMHDAKEHRVNMRPDSRQRKEAWVAEKKGRKAYTVLVDNRDKFEGGKFKSQYSGHKYYYAEGVGAFSLNTMIKAGSLADIKKDLGL